MIKKDTQDPDIFQEMMVNEIDRQTYWLFNRYFGIIPSKVYYMLCDKAEEQIYEFGWDETFKSWKKYLFTECKTPESAINFANLFWSYGGQDHPVSEPYEFLGYFYFRIDFDTEKYDAGGILDSLAIDLLPRAGYSYADPNINCDYVPELDPRIISAAKAWKSAGL